MLHRDKPRGQLARTKGPIQCSCRLFWDGCRQLRTSCSSAATRDGADCETDQTEDFFHAGANWSPRRASGGTVQRAPFSLWIASIFVKVPLFVSSMGSPRKIYIDGARIGGPARHQIPARLLDVIFPRNRRGCLLRQADQIHASGLVHAFGALQLEQPHHV
jgi:hypothetical protein